MYQNHPNIIALLLISLIIPLLSLALPSDENKTMTIQANRAILNQQKNSATFIGNVIVHQGTTQLTAHKLVTHRAKDSNDDSDHSSKKKILAYGDPAHYQTRTTSDKQPLQAWAKQIIYHQSSGLIILKKQAKIKQGNNLLKAPYIRYDSTHNIIHTEKRQQQTTTITIHPSSSKQKGN